MKTIICGKYVFVGEPWLRRNEYAVIHNATGATVDFIRRNKETPCTCQHEGRIDGWDVEDHPSPCPYLVAFQGGADRGEVPYEDKPSTVARDAALAEYRASRKRTP